MSVDNFEAKEPRGRGRRWALKLLAGGTAAGAMAAGTAALGLQTAGGSQLPEQENPLVPAEGKSNLLPPGWRIDLKVTTINPNKANQITVTYGPGVDPHYGQLRFMRNAIDNPPGQTEYVVYKRGAQINYEPETGVPGLMVSDTLVHDVHVDNSVRQGLIALYDRPSFRSGQVIGNVIPTSQVFRLRTLVEGQNGEMREADTLFQFNGQVATVLGFAEIPPQTSVAGTSK